MASSLLGDAFGHHVWATRRLLDACSGLSEEQLGTSVAGTFGSIVDTLRHIVGADRSYLALLSHDAVERVDESRLDVAAMRRVIDENAPVWDRVVAEAVDPDVVVVRRYEDGREFAFPLGIRLAQVVYHGTDHRSQVSTALTELAIEPPSLQVWDYAEASGRGSGGPAPR